MLSSKVEGPQLNYKIPNVPFPHHWILELLVPFLTQQFYPSFTNKRFSLILEYK